MDRYCVIGNPVAHSRSPWIHARFAALTGQVLHYDRLLVEPEGFAEAVARLRTGGARGCNVTVPFKFEAAALATQTTPRAHLAQACNTLRFDGGSVFADNTDGVGLVRDIEGNAGVALRGADVLLVGAGGAAAGVLGPLLEAGPRRIVVANRTAARAQALAGRHAVLAQQHGALLCGVALEAVQGDFAVVVNATAASLAGSSLAIPATALREGALAYDMMYGPAAQGFMDWAAGHGAVPRDGLGMLVEQAAEAFLVWRGVRPPSATVLAELRALIAS